MPLTAEKEAILEKVKKWLDEEHVQYERRDDPKAELNHELRWVLSQLSPKEHIKQ